MDLATIARAVAPSHARVGATDLAPFPEVLASLEERTASGLRGGLGFTYRAPEMACTPQDSFPWGRSIVVVAVPYLRDGDGVSDLEGGVDAERSIARFADGDRYADLRSVLVSVAAVLESDGFRTEVVFDDDRLVDRAAAVRAGVAWWGKSTMALAPGMGPWFLIGSVITDAEIDGEDPMVRDCGTCDACIPACPTRAIVAPGVLDARRCLAALFQGRGAIDRDLRRSAGTRVYGCDACLVACPPGHRALGIVDAAATIHPRVILAMTDDEILRTFSHWYIPGRKARFIRRNALIALGNRRSPEDIPVAAKSLGHEDPLVRAHAAWALGMIGGHRSMQRLRRAKDLEHDPEVTEEIEAALQYRA